MSKLTDWIKSVYHTLTSAETKPYTEVMDEVTTGISVVLVGKYGVSRHETIRITSSIELGIGALLELSDKQPEDCTVTIKIDRQNNKLILGLSSENEPNLAVRAIPLD